MSLVKFDIARYISKPLIGAGLVYVYDMFVEGRKFGNSLVNYDALVMGGSLISSTVLKDVITGAVGLQPESIQFKLVEPLINSFIYAYGYRFFLRDFGGNYTLRKDTMNYMIGFVTSFISEYFENPISALVTGVKSY